METKKTFEFEKEIHLSHKRNHRQESLNTLKRQSRVPCATRKLFSPCCQSKKKTNLMIDSFWVTSANSTVHYDCTTSFVSASLTYISRNDQLFFRFRILANWFVGSLVWPSTPHLFVDKTQRILQVHPKDVEGDGPFLHMDVLTIQFPSLCALENLIEEQSYLPADLDFKANEPSLSCKECDLEVGQVLERDLKEAFETSSFFKEHGYELKQFVSQFRDWKALFHASPFEFLQALKYVVTELTSVFKHEPHFFELSKKEAEILFLQ